MRSLAVDRHESSHNWGGVDCMVFLPGPNMKRIKALRNFSKIFNRDHRDPFQMDIFFTVPRFRFILEGISLPPFPL